MASQLDLDRMYELVGDLMRDTFSADLVYVAMHDPETDRIEFAYYSEGGDAGPRSRASRSAQGLTSQHPAQPREPLLLNRRRGLRGDGVQAWSARPVKSYLGVPILRRRPGDRRDQRPEHDGGGPVRRRPTPGCWRRSPRTSASRSRTPSCYRDAGRRLDEMAALADVAREISATLDLGRCSSGWPSGRATLLEVDTSAVFLAERGRRGRSRRSSRSGSHRRRDPRRHDPARRGDHRRRGGRAAGARS